MPTGVTAGVTASVLRLLKYGNRAQLEALAKLCGKEEGFNDGALVLGEDSAKVVYAAFMVAIQIRSKDAEIAEYRRLWELAKGSLPEEVVSYDIANQLGIN